MRARQSPPTAFESPDVSPPEPTIVIPGVNYAPLTVETERSALQRPCTDSPAAARTSSTCTSKLAFEVFKTVLRPYIDGSFPAPSIQSWPFRTILRPAKV
ncbi:hypothetical protein J1614_009109 [Plenodomus biglobosus]|nr:hypothetical protein J1614_009109 [Plenodomus biglobosus]